LQGFSVDATLDDVMVVFTPFEQPENIHMRKRKDKLTQKYIFKGSVFATFKTREAGQKFLDAKDVKVGDVDLLRKWQ